MSSPEQPAKRDTNAEQPAAIARDSKVLLVQPLARLCTGRNEFRGETAMPWLQGIVQKLPRTPNYSLCYILWLRCMDFTVSEGGTSAPLLSHEATKSVFICVCPLLFPLSWEYPDSKLARLGDRSINSSCGHYFFSWLTPRYWAIQPSQRFWHMSTTRSPRGYGQA